MLKELKITDIKVGTRHRKDMGDLTDLADSIRQEGMLQPIGVTDRLELVFGERRIRAVRDILRKKTITARIVDVTSIIAGEYAENEVRKDFTPSERVAIAKAIERQIGNRRGQRTDKQRVQKIAQVDPGEKTRDKAAEKAGFGNHETYRQAAKVVTNGTPTLIQAMDDGRVSISAAAILVDADPDEQEAVLELDEKAILQAAKEIRQRQTAARNDQQHEAENRARRNSNGKKTWKITSDQKVIQCDLLIADPPYGITKERWEPDDLEGFTRKWCRKWSSCGADFLAIFWSQEHLWHGRKWFDEALSGYSFQQMLIWHANNHCSLKSRKLFKQTWEPVFLYRRVGSQRQIISPLKQWDAELHNLDCVVVPVPQVGYCHADLKQHPCQKPVAVMRWLIHALTEPGEMVCSPFCGVAPCGIAANQLDRVYHGIDTNAKYRHIAERRIATYGHEA
jgi:DNA modification methylase